VPALTRLRIVQLTPCLWSGGTEERIARVLGAMDRREFDVTWMGFGPVREALIERAGPEIRVIPIPRNAAGGVEPALVLRIAMALSRIRPDVMHIHNWSTSLYGAAAARVAGVPRTIFGLGGRETPEPANDRRRRAMRTLAPHFDRFTTVCEFLAKEVERDFAVSPERVRVLRTGVDVARIEAAPPRGEVRRGLGIPDGAVVIGAISVFRPVKRIPDLIDAVGVLAQDRADVHLLLVGNPVGMTVEELRLRAEARGLGGRVHLPGRIEDPAKLLPAFDVFVNCSAFEGSSNAIIEAMAAGIPVVGTAVGGMLELI
jgi:glycosyltransferase involved in cell wall biosynthesis